MRKLPDWYAKALADHARLIVAGEGHQDSAMISLRILIRDIHREFGNLVLDDFNGPLLREAIAAATPKPVTIPAQVLAVLDAEGATGLSEAELGNRAYLDKPERMAAELIRQDVATYAPSGNLTLTDKGREEAKAKLAMDYHLTLFPDIPARLKVTVTKSKPVTELTTHELDMARNMWTARCDNAIEGSKAELARNEAWYSKIRPVMQDGDTVADAERRLGITRHAPGPRAATRPPAGTPAP